MDEQPHRFHVNTSHDNRNMILASLNLEGKLILKKPEWGIIFRAAFQDSVIFTGLRAF